MSKSFSECYEYYKSTCHTNKHLNGSMMQDPFGEKRGNFNYDVILRRVEALRVKLAAENQHEHSDEGATDSDDISDD